MQRRQWVIMGSLLGLLLVFAIVWLHGGPTYQGKPLRVWLTDFDPDQPEACWAAAEAVRHMGTNAVPQLVSRLRRGPPRPEPRWRQKIRAVLSRQSVVKIPSYRPGKERGETLAGLDALGPNAGAAVPALEDLLREKPPDHRALLVLGRIGPEAVPALTRALTNEVSVIRLGARSCLDMMRTNSDLLFPKTAKDAEFGRRTARFNMILLQASFKEYKAQHPDRFVPTTNDSTQPRFPPENSITNKLRASLPSGPPGRTS